MDQQTAFSLAIGCALLTLVLEYLAGVAGKLLEVAEASPERAFSTFDLGGYGCVICVF